MNRTLVVEVHDEQAFNCLQPAANQRHKKRQTAI